MTWSKQKLMMKAGAFRTVTSVTSFQTMKKLGRTFQETAAVHSKRRF